MFSSVQSMVGYEVESFISIYDDGGFAVVESS